MKAYWKGEHGDMSRVFTAKSVEDVVKMVKDNHPDREIQEIYEWTEVGNDFNWVQKV